MSNETIKVLDRAFIVLRLLASKPGGFTLPELCDRLDLSKSTARRFLNTLCKAGFAELDNDGQRYKLGMLMLTLSTGLSQQNALTVAVHPILEELQARSGETAALWLRIGSVGLCLSSVESPQFVRTVSPIGYTVPLFAGAHGKQLLAGLSSSELEEYLAETDVARLTPATIVSRDALRREVSRIQRRGWSLSRGEINADAVGVAAPILNAFGAIFACVSVTAPAHRIDDDRIEGIADRVVDAAAEATRRVTGPQLREEDQRVGEATASSLPGPRSHRVSATPAG